MHDGRRPPLPHERHALGLFRFLAPRLPRVDPIEPPAALAPWEEVEVPRPGRDGALAATWYPARGPVRGAALLLPPWVPWGRAYFHRRPRIRALRQAALHTLTLDFPGFGGSGPPAGFFDLDVDDALTALANRAPGLPLFVWGVSAGGYWAHPVLARRNGVRAAFFEDVSPHLLEWSAHERPVFRPFFFLFRTLFPAAYRFLDMRRHAEAFRVERSVHVSGELDPGVRPEDTRELARRAGGAALVVPGAGHLEAIKTATDEVIGRALAEFEAAR
jgi:pimeloyl-ACP methyl ester carboxylesterase